MDEPTSALGVHQTANVLATLGKVRKQDISVAFLTHNIGHAMAAGDRFIVLNRGTAYGTANCDEITPEELQVMMAGGQELATFEGSLDGTIQALQRLPKSTPCQSSCILPVFFGQMYEVGASIADLNLTQLSFLKPLFFKILGKIRLRSELSIHHCTIAICAKGCAPAPPKDIDIKSIKGGLKSRRVVLAHKDHRLRHELGSEIV